MPGSTRIEGLEDLLGKLETLQQMQTVAGALLAGGDVLKSAMQAYPPRTSPTRKAVYGASFQSDRQRRFFFYALKKGLIQVPYRRKVAAGLQGRWTVTVSNQGLTVEVGNNISYGPLVQKAGMQSRYAKAVGWQTDEDVVRRDGPKVVEFVKDEIDKALGGE